MISIFIFDTTKVLFWKRLAAQFIDCSLVFLTVIVLTSWFTPLGSLFLWMLVWTYLIYSILMDAYREGTVGKLYMGLKVVNTQEGSSNLITSSYRNVMKLFIALFLYDILLLIIRKGYSGFHNKIAKTIIVERVSSSTVANKHIH
jgi:uncharacterized RDD family membrane protein YckC